MVSPTRQGSEPSAEGPADRPADLPRVGTATVHGTFGELLQGYRRHADSGYQHFLFTLPVAEYCATSTVSLTPGQCRPSVQPAGRTRALTAAANVARALGLSSAEVNLEIDSNIPVGKGCASSTADVMASVAALLDAANSRTPAAVVHALGSLVAKEIEWGDYVFSDSITLCLQRTHTLVHAYATDLRWFIVGVDEGGVVDTAAFHRRQRESKRHAQYFDLLAAQLDTALRVSDFTTAAHIATESALINQRELPKRNMALMQQVAASAGALGIAIAHTGTVIGLIFSGHQSDAALRMHEARQLLERAGLTSETFSVREPGRGSDLAER